MKNTLAKTISLLARGIAPTAVVSSLLSPVASAAPGDLDPTFADIGRLGPLPGFAGSAGTLELLSDNDGILFGGGNFEEECNGWSYYYCTYHFDAHGFLGRSLPTGAIDPAYFGAGLQDTEVLDVALQGDGKAIAVGRTATGTNRSAFSVLRLERDGTLDQTFGQSGVTSLPAWANTQAGASSVAIDPDGRIVVAGTSGDQLVLVRLLQDGRLDPSFGDDGVFSGPPADSRSLTKIVRTTSGAYRIAANLRDFRNRATFGSPCLLVGLTVNGELDQDFGTLGVVSDDEIAGSSAACGAMVAQTDGKLLLVGNDDSTAFARRLLSNGDRDPGFDANAVSAGLTDATALAVRGNGSILVAGRGPVGISAALIMQLQANGELDVLFGDAGSTAIDLASAFGTTPYVNDIKVMPDGRVLAAGGDIRTFPPRPFLVRLVGEGGSGGRGVVGMKTVSLDLKEQAQQAVMTVGRMGGELGDISVAHRTAPGLVTRATAGQDYTPVSGVLQWSDGDTADKQIVVPIASDAAIEEPEEFIVELSDVQGGGGLGTRNATVRIAADGEPAGQVAFDVISQVVNEANGFAALIVSRNFYATGAVSVTVTTAAGTATAGEDFEPQTVVVPWADGETGSKAVAIAIRDDATSEDSESFTVTLSNPTGGAVVGSRGTATIRIAPSDRPLGSRGGGALDWLGLLLLGLVRLLHGTSRGTR